MNNEIINGKNSSNQSNLEMVKDINNTLKQIMHEPNATNIANNIKSNRRVPISINNLSSSIINEIGQYLCIKDLCHFEVTNQKNFVSLRYPYPALKYWICL